MISYPKMLPGLILLLLCYCFTQAQTDTNFLDVNTDTDLQSLLEDDEKPVKEYVKNAFKSSRVINGHSMEFIGSGVLDFRILHRFGTFKSGYRELFGLDQASMRMGFDLGITKNFTLGIGRSTFNKELDGFMKWRIIHQRKNVQPIPFSLVWVSGITMTTGKIPEAKLNILTNRLGFYNQLILGRKFGESFTLQLSPTHVHRNLVEFNTDKNDMIALGIGSRIKLTNRSAFIIDAFPILYGDRKNYNVFPLSLGFDIETGGHVFQLHISNAKGMNEKAFITETVQRWDKGEIQLGFNLSRVFTVVKNKATSW
ncbi:MAG: hypothetical protein JNJ58_02575 [Chitinophagaceae bacterium]|nr:hypothetical protein [Chitinophagaceae bacterium]